MSFKKYGKSDIAVNAVNLTEDLKIGDTGIVMTVYRSSIKTDGRGGNIGVKIWKPGARQPFYFCQFLDLDHAEFFIGGHTVLCKFWPEIRRIMLANGAESMAEVNSVGKTPVAQAPVAQAPVEAQPKTRKRRITADDVIPMRAAPADAPVQAAPVAPAPQVDINALAAQVNLLAQAVNALLAPRQ